MTSTMTRDQAAMFRAAYEGAVKRYSKMTKVQLRNEWLIALSQTGAESLYGGPSSKDELISAVLNLRGYTIAKLNETIHVLGHEPGERWSGCGFCQCQEFRTVPSVMVPGCDQLIQCVLDPDHDGMHSNGEAYAWAAA